jgi:hypothetical protein
MKIIQSSLDAQICSKQTDRFQRTKISVAPTFWREFISLSSVISESGSRLSSIETSAFRHCPSLLSICLPSSIQTVAAMSFTKCRSLVAVTFETGCRLSSIETEAFRYCSSLSSIRIPSAIKELGPFCFDDCPSLCAVHFESDSELSSLECGLLGIVHHSFRFSFRRDLKGCSLRIGLRLWRTFWFLMAIATSK